MKASTLSPANEIAAMSALGQKQTFRIAIGMSALPPIADCAVQLGMSAVE